MNQILERVELEYWSKKPYSFEIKITENNIENPNFLRNLNKSSYFAYLNNNIGLCNQILEEYITLPFNGNYDQWTWIESGIYLKMFICLESNEKDIYDGLKKIIYNQFELSDIPESTRRINLKAFTRGLSGSLLNSKEVKIKQVVSNGDIDLEFMGLMAYFAELIFIYSMNEGSVDNNIKEKLTNAKSRLLEIIDYYKSNS